MWMAAEVRLNGAGINLDLELPVTGSSLPPTGNLRYWYWYCVLRGTCGQLRFADSPVGECPEWIALQAKLRAHIGAESCPLSRCGSVHSLKVGFWIPGIAGHLDCGFLIESDKAERYRRTLKTKLHPFHFPQQSHPVIRLFFGFVTRNTACASRALSPTSIDSLV